MQPWMIDAVIVLLILGITYALASEGAWGAALMFFNVLFGGLIAFNFYEPLAKQFIAWGMSGAWCDFLSLMLIFLISVGILRACTDIFSPGMVRLPTPVYHLGRLIFGAGTAVVTMAILLCVLETAPVHRKIFGMINYDTKTPFGMGWDRAWLAFVQRSSGNVFTNYNIEDQQSDPLFDTANAFDRNASWLIDHQNARPYPEGDEGKVPEPE